MKMCTLWSQRAEYRDILFFTILCYRQAREQQHLTKVNAWARNEATLSHMETQDKVASFQVEMQDKIQ